MRVRCIFSILGLHKGKNYTFTTVLIEEFLYGLKKRVGLKFFSEFFGHSCAPPLKIIVYLIFTSFTNFFSVYLLFFLFLLFL